MSANRCGIDISMLYFFFVMRKLLLCVCCCCLLYSCTDSQDPVEKYQRERNNIVEVKDRVVPILDDDEVLIASSIRVNWLDGYLIVQDFGSKDKFIHIFDGTDYKYLGSTASHSDAPGDLSNMGLIQCNPARHVFYVSDHGKNKIFGYNIPKLLSDTTYLPFIKARIKAADFPSQYAILNDSLALACMIRPDGVSGYDVMVARWNMHTGVAEDMPYKHPETHHKRIAFTASVEDSLYVEAYTNYDLMTICDLQGNLKYNIYGPNWVPKQDRTAYFKNIRYIRNHIVASYLAEERIREDKIRGRVGNCPTKLIIFDKKGDYCKTLDVGYRITSFCYDEWNDRLVMSIDGEFQFAYLDLKGLF